MSVETSKHHTPTTDTYTPAMSHADETLFMYKSGICSWKECCDANKDAVSEIRNRHFEKEIASWSETLQSTDPKDIWNKIDWKGNSGNGDIFDHSPEIEDLASQFKSKDSDTDENVLGIDFGSQKVPVLDKNISREELDEASRRKINS